MIELKNVSKHYRSAGKGKPRAVNNVSFTLKKGEILSVIGESGSGKTTIGNMVLKLTNATGGKILFAGQDIAKIRGRKKLKEYYRQVQGVFQDPFSTFNPIFKADRVFDIIHREFCPQAGAAAWNEKVNEKLQDVGLNPGEVRGKFPHQLSGGQLQRFLIARALLLEAKVLVADEIISMLDASTRIDVLNLLGVMRANGLSMIFVTHDLSLGYYISDRVVILYKGVMVESGDTKAVFSDPQHPYSRALLDSVPRLDRKWSQMPVLPPSAHSARMYDPDLHVGDPVQELIGDDHWIAVHDGKMK